MLSLQKTSGFVLWPSTDWVWPTHIMEGKLLYLQLTDCLITSTNTFTETPRLVFDQATGCHSQVDTKLTMMYGFQTMSITVVLCLIYVMILC